MIEKVSRVVTVLIAATMFLLGPAVAAKGAGGWVANSCAVQQSLHATMTGTHPETGDGRRVVFIPCGTGMSGVKSVDAGPNTPYYVDPTGPRPPFCMHAGQDYYPNDNGAVLIPTARCR